MADTDVPGAGGDLAFQHGADAIAKSQVGEADDRRRHPAATEMRASRHGRLAAADRSNNDAEAHVYLQGLADLAVASASVVQGAYQQGKPLTVRAVIANNGIAVARNFTVEVFAKTDADGALRVARTVIDQLNPNTTTPVALVVDTSKLLGTVTLQVVVDRSRASVDRSSVSTLGTGSFK